MTVMAWEAAAGRMSYALVEENGDSREDGEQAGVQAELGRLLWMAACKHISFFGYIAYFLACLRRG